MRYCKVTKNSQTEEVSDLLEDAFPDGSIYCEFWPQDKFVDLDGSFTVEQLQVIINVMQKLELGEKDANKTV